MRVGVLVNDIQQLDLKSHSYNVDMHMWFKWKDGDIYPSRSFEFMNAFELYSARATDGSALRLPKVALRHGQPVSRRNRMGTSARIDSNPR